MNSREKRLRIMKVIFMVLKFMRIAVYAVLLIGMVLFTFNKIEGDSMYPFLHDGDVVMTTRTAKNIDYNDVVAFKKDGSWLIKRVVALPGDSVKTHEHTLYVNGERRRYPVDVEEDIDIVLDDKDVYVLGDNWQNSCDSLDFGPVKNYMIANKLFFRNPVRYIIYALSFCGITLMFHYFYLLELYSYKKSIDNQGCTE